LRLLGCKKNTDVEHSSSYISINFCNYENDLTEDDSFMRNLNLTLCAIVGNKIFDNVE